MIFPIGGESLCKILWILLKNAKFNDIYLRISDKKACRVVRSNSVGTLTMIVLDGMSYLAISPQYFNPFFVSNSANTSDLTCMPFSMRKSVYYCKSADIGTCFAVGSGLRSPFNLRKCFPTVYLFF